MTRIWDRANLHAWCVVPFDDLKRGPEERAQMLVELGIRNFAYDWREENISEFVAELEALNRHGITLIGWWWQGLEADGRSYALDAFASHGVRPRLWVMQGENLYPDKLPTTEFERRQRIEFEAQRINCIADSSPGYGIDLYTHNDWFGVVDNQIMIIDRARELGTHDIGISYNFSHARDALHDDTENFAALWARAQPYVSSVNLAGTHFEDGTTLFPGDGEHDQDMMLTIERSGWRGPVGIIAETGGDARASLATALARVTWLSAELEQRGSGGVMPAPIR